MTHLFVNPHGSSPSEERRQQILQAAMSCFAVRGFHQTTMQDISAAAGISVGLIYRYFSNKEEVIAAMASEHTREMKLKLERARGMGSLLDALDHILWCDDCTDGQDLQASFVADLYAESGRNPHVRELVRGVHEEVLAGIAALIHSSPEATRLAPGMTPRHAAETIVQSLHGLMFDEIVLSQVRTHHETKKTRLETLRRLFGLLFPTLGAEAPRRSAAHHEA